MDPLQMLERYYNAFVEENNSKAFFLGLADYLDYAVTLPEFERIKKNILATQKPSTQELRKLEQSALYEIETVKTEIDKYIKKHAIEDSVVKRALNDYNDYQSGAMLSSDSMASLLYEELSDVVTALDKIPEHQEFARCFVEMSKPNGARVIRYLPLEATDDFFDAETRLQRGQKVELWGQLQSILSRYEVVRRGHDRRLALMERSRLGESQATWELLNYTGIIHEWKQIENDEIERGTIYFVVSSVRPLVVRLHNYILGQWNTVPLYKSIEQEETEVVKPKHKPVLFTEKGKGYFKFYKEGRCILVGKTTTRKYRLVKALIDPLGVAKNVNVVFEEMRDTKDNSDTRLKDAYTAIRRKREIIDNTMKELQKIKWLTGHISLVYHHDGSTVALKLK